LTKEKSELEAVDLDEWGNWNSPTELLISSEDQVSISGSRYADSEQGRDELAERCIDAEIDEPCFSPTISPITESKRGTAYKCPSQTRLRRPYYVNPSLSEGKIQFMPQSEMLPGATTLDTAIVEEADSDYSQGLEARGPQTRNQSKKRKSSTDKRAKRKVLCPTKKQKSSHNAIEKRYRNNLNGKIAALQKVVPGLREASSHKQIGNDAKDTKDEPIYKYRKAAILGQAIEYIAYLEGSTERLGRETFVLNAQVIAFKKQLVNLDAIVAGRVECSQIPTGETLKTIQKSTGLGVILYYSNGILTKDRLC
jgi:hypothetical protein